MISLSKRFGRPNGHDISYLSRILVFVKPYWVFVLGAGIALVCTATGVLGLGVGLRQLIDDGFSKGDVSALEHSLFLLMLLALIMAFGTFARFYLISWVGERVVADLRQAVFERVLSLHVGFFEVTKTGEILSRITTDTTLLQSIIGSSASIALRNVLNLLGGVVMLFITNPKLTSFVFLLVPIVVIPIMFFGRRVRKLSRASQDSIADVGAFAEETINGIRTVQACAHESVDCNRFKAEVSKAFNIAVSRIRTRGLLSAVIILLVFSAISLILWIGGQSMLLGEITGGELASFVYYAVIVAFSVGVLSEVYGELLRAAGATERLVDLLEIESEIKNSKELIMLPMPPRGEIKFNCVTFNYPSRPQYAALQEFSLDVRSGETIALVGPSGSGKSTVFQLLLRFYDPNKGSIKIDGINIKTADVQSVRKRCSFVPQDPVIFGTNVWENIRYGRPEATGSQVEAAAEAAAALEFIRLLPNGFDTFLGEKGVRLSGGQRQRISLARALVQNPSILLLDEATSSLDSQNEEIIQDALENLKKGRTTIVIAHRLATIVKADKIVVIEKGKVVDIGKHESLLKSCSLYARLAELQFETTV